MTVTKAEFDAAAKNLLGAEYYAKFVAAGANRADLCVEIAKQFFVQDLDPDDRERMHSDIFKVQCVALNLRRDGNLGLAD